MVTVSFVAAASGSGKTTLIEKIIPLLASRGLRVAVIKHASGGFELDKPGKDSWRFQQAGAEAVVLAGPERLALLKTVPRTPPVQELQALVAGADVALYEGFKHDAPNKIEVFRAGVSGERPLCLHDPSFIALASDTPFDVAVPRFDLNDAHAVADFILRQRGR